MDRTAYDIEWRVGKTHWWFSGRRRLLKSLLSSIPLRKDAPALDIGCGVGSHLGLLSSMGLRVLGVDSAIYCLAYAKQNVPGVGLVNGNLLDLPFKRNSMGFILAMDVLEHLDQDLQGIKEIYSTLIQDGIAVFTVPAFRFLWGVQDVVTGHRRRYTRAEMSNRLKQGGFTILASSYFNFFLFLPILIARRLIRLAGVRVESENEINSPLINSVLKAIFSLEPPILRYLSFPFGVSIFFIVKKA